MKRDAPSQTLIQGSAEWLLAVQGLPLSLGGTSPQGLFTDAKARKNHAQQIVGAELARDLIERDLA